MRTKENIQVLMDFFQEKVGRPLNFDKEPIFIEFSDNNHHQSWIIKILSVLGGILATLAFLGFLFSRIYDSQLELLIAGLVLIFAAIWVQRVFATIIIDTICVSSFLVGFILLGLGMSNAEWDENLLSLVFIVVSILSLVVAQNYMLSFVSFLIISGNIFALFMMNDKFDWIHLYVAILAVVLTVLFLKEAKIITGNKRISKLYRPFRIGIIFSFLGGLFMFSKSGILSVSTNYLWISAVVIIATILVLLYKICIVLNIFDKKYQILVCLIGLVLLSPTALYPLISGAILLILLSFLINYITGLAIGIITFIYSISQYYYDLNLTLLTKSMILFTSGILFLLLYLFTHKKLNSDEKI